MICVQKSRHFHHEVDLAQFLLAPTLRVVPYADHVSDTLPCHMWHWEDLKGDPPVVVDIKVCDKVIR